MSRLAAALLAITVAGCGAQAQSEAGGRVRVEATAVPVAKDAFATSGHAFSAGTVALTSPDTSRLHGLSDLKIDADGRLTAISDEGDLLTAHLVLKPDATLSGLDDAELRPLTGPDGRPVQGKEWSDAEGVAVWPDGRRMVSFERHHRIWIYPTDGGPPADAPIPQIAMGDNEGMEGLALAPSRGPDAYWVGVEAGPVFLCRLSAGCERQDGVPNPGLLQRLSGLVETSRGELVVLHHRWNPLTKQSGLTVLLLRPGPSGARLIGRMTIEDPAILDNYEGVETAALPGGGLRLFLLVDDNFSASQRTLFSAVDWYPKGR